MEEKIQPSIAAESHPGIRLGLVLGLVICGLIYFLRLDNVVGLTVDDAWYVLLAKGLATGSGYTLINSPTPGILPLYPPGFPFLLSLFYRLSPSFPGNLWLLKSVSIVAMLATGALSFRYFMRMRKVAPIVSLLIAMAAVLCPPLVFLATSTVMSECVFALALIASIVAAEQAALLRGESAGKAMGLVLGTAALASYAFLTRSIALALIGGIFLFFLKERLPRAALVFALGVALFTGPWVIYSRLHAPSPEQMREQGGHIIQPYAIQFWQRVASVTTSEQITAAELPSRVWNNILEIAGKDILRIAAAPFYEAMRDPYKEAQRLLSQQLTDKTEDTLFLSYVLSLLILIGFIAVARQRITCAEIVLPMMLAITVLWPWETIRFILPLAPLLLFYLAMGVGAIARLIRPAAAEKSRWLGPALAAGLALAIGMYGNIGYIAKKSGDSLDRPQWLQTFDDVETMMRWVSQNVPQNETIVTLNPPLTYMYTGHKTVAWDRPAEKWDLWKQLGIRHLAWYSAYYVPPEPGLRAFSPRYSGRNQLGFQVLDLGPPESRPAWGSGK